MSFSLELKSCTNLARFLARNQQCKVSCMSENCLQDLAKVDCKIPARICKIRARKRTFSVHGARFLQEYCTPLQCYLQILQVLHARFVQDSCTNLAYLARQFYLGSNMPKPMHEEVLLCFCRVLYD